jgi:RHS repeat-associated protein
VVRLYRTRPTVEVVVANHVLGGKKMHEASLEALPDQAVGESTSKTADAIRVSGERRARVLRHRAPWRLVLLLVVALTLFLVIAGSAFASAIVVDEGEWFIYLHSQLGFNYMMAPIVTDFQCGTPGAQVAILSPEKRPIYASHTWFNERTNSSYEYTYLFDHQLTISPYPQLTTLGGGGLLSQGYVGLEVLDTYADPYAKADQLYHDGYWKLYYDDNTSEVVDDFPSCPLCWNPNDQKGWDPVSFATGTSTNTFIDLQVPVKGATLAFARTNKSLRARQSGPVGNGWRHNYQTALSFPDASTVTVVYPDACMCNFILVGSGATAEFMAPIAVDDKLKKQPDGSYTLKEKSGTTFHYTSAGLLSGISDRYGNQTAISYSGSLVTDITDSSGRSIHLVYSGPYIVEAQARTNGVTQESVTYTYNAGGDLTSSTDANGHVTSYSYNAAHQLVSVRQPRAVADPTMDPLFTSTFAGNRVTAQSDALGNSQSLVIDQAARTSTVTDARDNETIYTWDDAYSLTGLIDPLGGTWSIAYGAKGHPTAVTDPNDNTVRIEYDANSNVTSYHDAEGHIYRALYDASNNPLWVQDPLGERLSRTTTGLLARDDFGSNSLSTYTQASEGSSSPTWTFTSGLLNQTVWAYATASLRRNTISGAACASAYLTPKAGSQVDLLVATGAKDSTNTAFLGYSARLSTTAASLQKRTSGTWTELATQSYATSGGTYRQVRLYVDDGTVYMKAGSTDLSAVSISATDSTYTSGSGGIRASSQCSYDFLELRASQKVTVTGLPSGYLVRVTRGSATAEATASSGTAVIDAGALLFPLDKLEVFDTSALEVAELTSLDLADMGGGDEFAYDDDPGHRTTFAWDATGTFLDSVTSPVGTTSFDWNTDGSLDSITDANSHTWSCEYDNLGSLVSALDPLGHGMAYEYDAIGRLTAVEDANSSRLELAYDNAGMLTQITDPLAEDDPLNRHQIDFSYDPDGNMTEIEDANGHVTSFAYDNANRISFVEDALSGESVLGYDASGNLTSVEDPGGHTVSYSYDSCDRVDSRTDPVGEVTAYGYDPTGNLSWISYPNGNETTMAYDDNDRLVEIGYETSPTSWGIAYTRSGKVSQVDCNDGRTWTLQYDSADRLTEATDENNGYLGPLAVEWTYDGDSNVTGLAVGSLVSVAMTYDGRGLIETLTDDGGQTTFTHDEGGRLAEIATPDGSSRSMTFDAANRPTEVQNVTASGTETLEYAYDSSGNLLSEDESEFGYDALDRLVSWYDPITQTTTTYAYDSSGNLLQVSIDSTVVESYTYNAADEICNSGYSYDDNGNLLSDGTHTYTYDEEDRLVQVSDAMGTCATMTYDHAGRRTSLATAEGTTFYHYAGGLLVAESDETGAVLATYVYGAEGGLISMSRGGNTYYYQTNAHGDVVSLTSANGMVVNSYDYDPWGAPLSSTETVQNPFRYAGYYYDAATGLYYLWHRYYAPDLRRFLTRDLVGGSSERTQTYNRYCYVADNPTTLQDAAGQTPGSNWSFLWDFLHGVKKSDRTRNYYRGDVELEEMLRSPGVQQLRRDFASGGYKCIEGYSYGGKWGLDAAWDTIIKNVLNPFGWGNLGSTAVQVGSWTADVVNNGDGTATYTIKNVASMKSFLYHATRDSWNHEGGPMGNITQVFEWTEPIPSTWSGGAYPAA